MANVEIQKNHTELSFVILAGGKSSRMGFDKCLLSFLGKPLIERIIDIVDPISNELFIVANDEKLNYLNVKIVKDNIAGLGALGGLYTALLEAKNEFVSVVGCDLPFISTDILLEAYRIIQSTQADVVIPKTSEGFYEPLHAIYRRGTCKEAILTAISKGERRLISWFSAVKVVEMNNVLCESLDPEGIAFLNINTQADYNFAEDVANKKLNKTAP